MEPELHGPREIGGSQVFTGVWPNTDLINDRLGELVRAKNGDQHTQPPGRNVRTNQVRRRDRG